MKSTTICLLGFFINAFLVGLTVYKNHYAVSVGWAAFSLFYLAYYIVNCIKEHIDSKFKELQK